jgi:hypothetical protein
MCPWGSVGTCDTIYRKKLVDLHSSPEYDLGSELLGHSLFRKKLIELQELQEADRAPWGRPRL